jgi:ribosome biogenesis GTPase / thiamine phosphate phosphatase
MNLQELGYSHWFKDKLQELGGDEAFLARVVTVDRDRYTIAGVHGTMPAEATGKLLYCADTLEDMPCVGDWVLVEYLDNNEHAVVHTVLPRKTILRRRAAGSQSAYQPIASNIDIAYIVQSCNVDYSLNRLDRYTVMAADGGIASRLLLTKCDLVDKARLDDLISGVRKEHHVDVVAISSVTGDGFAKLTQTLQKGVTYCLLGSSGVGKSTLLNRLLGAEDLAVGDVREKSGKGRHTTTRRQLIVMENGALFVDTPGMRELGMMAFDAGLEESYQDIAAAAGQCRYPDCTHTVENGCAVLAKVSAGQLSQERYESYLKLLKESRYFEMTSVEKRQKDRTFGKMLKNYEKFHKKH